MIQIEEKEIVKGIDEAYKKAGSNAYFGNGFKAGVDFALERVKNLAIPDVVGESEQLPCDCDVPLAETTLQVYCPKCYKTYKMK